MAERVGNLGYAAFSTETTPGTPAAAPSVFTLLDNETMTTMYNLEDETPVAGMPVETFQVLPGLRTHKGDIEIVAEPNTALEVFDSLLTRGTVSTSYTFTVTSANATAGATYTNNGITYTVTSTISSATTLIATGSGAPLTSGTLTKASGTGDATITFSAAVAGTSTWPFTLPASASPLPKSKTVDISTGNVVKRFVGVQASKVTPVFKKNQINLKVSMSALGSFQGAVLASTPTGTNPYTVVFDTIYDTNPTGKLFVGDLVRFYKTNGTTIDTTITSIVDSKTITTTTDVTSMAQGDMMYLRPATVNFSLLTPFLWSGTEFRFGTNAAAALSATQTRLEQGSSWEIDYDFESDDGSQRSGSADPASLVRMTAKSMLTAKKFFDTPDDVINFNQQNKTACVVRHFAISGGVTYELRITFNHMKTEDPLPKVKSKAVNYSEIKYHTQYSQSDSQLLDVKVIAGSNTIG